MKKLLAILALCVSFAAPLAQAAGHGVKWDEAPNLIHDKAALQNGAKLFVNYCLNCHSAKALRYNNLEKIGLTDTQIHDNLLFTGKKVGDLMTVAMHADDARVWFGTAPPDLSVMARAKAENLGAPGTDYIYTYLRSFYRDNSRPTGWNNLVFPNVGMPNPFWELQSPSIVTFTKVHLDADENGKPAWFKTVTQYDEKGYKHVLSNEKLPADYAGGPSEHHEVEYLNPGKQEEFDKNVADLTAFMGWMAEPDQVLRHRIGYVVMAFLFVFLFVCWRLNKAYWKHVK
ncbi:cytochrome c1 [Basilea psittacipulmonis]|uniref:Cytochrome C n=1 Tax=Basilea psittacipulmonis DSM 24701 TaxID=1072685 RepID=A0A077DD13_9BURK|nr:cytochrome c1 [Basilea psittacipulmonis]AIL32066.1 cytochrome C [Basilea psittacipulmonis DSM 24701]